jgi:hypothetical protein
MWIGERKVTLQSADTITRWRQSCSASQYWTRQSRARAAELTDWETVEWAFSVLPRHRQVWVSKQVSGMCSASTRMWAQGLRASVMCPRCPLDEDSEHVLCCRRVGTDEQWWGHMQSLQRRMVEADMDPSITVDLIHRLVQWRLLSPGLRISGRTLGERFSTSGVFPSEVHAKPVFGWRAVMESRLAVDWQLVYEECPAVGYGTGPPLVGNFVGSLVIILEQHRVLRIES